MLMKKLSNQVMTILKDETKRNEKKMKRKTMFACVKRK